MKIRLVRDGDYAAIARLRKQTIRNVNSKDYSEKIIQNWLSMRSAQDFRKSADECKRWVAIENEKIIGFCEHNFECEVSRIYVHKNYLRKGVGSRLLEVAEASLEKLGCKEIRIESTITAKDFYKIRGYRVTKKTTFKEDGTTIFKMLKKLS
ncbi:MAG: GNAT family N-acetyltransferase [Candidatus Pacebacteria bacterium]|nr:GNAT family N-acetyltransferase [Candidatus Paceibacterota bacterium]HCI03743.1 hypothetical protein [Candidatus Peribacteria bacterium]|tara:strand:+ start:161 stop:616 length:456 start_codon:yes stop_codon:yes gene_type:complete